MKVMTLHQWFDDEIEYVRWDGHADVREIVIKTTNEGALLISKEDAIALAKEFGLIVYPKDANF